VHADRDPNYHDNPSRPVTRPREINRETCPN
jgi:hypothetical protein